MVVEDGRRQEGTSEFHWHRSRHKEMSFLDSVQNLIQKAPKGVIQTAVIATALAASAAVYYTLVSPTSSSNLAPAIEEEEAQKVMNLLLKRLKILAPKLITAAQNIKMQIQQQGQDVEEAIIMKQFILPHFESSLKEYQDELLNEFDMDEDDLEEAVNTYIANGNMELADIAQSIRVMHNQFGGDSDIQDPNAPKSAKVEEMTLEEVVGLMKELGNQMMQYTDDFCGTFIDENGVPSNQQEMEAFQLGLMAASQKGEKALLDECQLTEGDLQSLLMKYQDKREVMMVFQQMQMDNQRILMKHGIRLG